MFNESCCQSDLSYMTHLSLSPGIMDRLVLHRINGVGRTFPASFMSINRLVPGFRWGCPVQGCAFLWHDYSSFNIVFTIIE